MISFRFLPLPVGGGGHLHDSTQLKRVKLHWNTTVISKLTLQTDSDTASSWGRSQKDVAEVKSVAFEECLARGTWEVFVCVLHTPVSAARFCVGLWAWGLVLLLSSIASLGSLSCSFLCPKVRRRWSPPPLGRSVMMCLSGFTNWRRMWLWDTFNLTGYLLPVWL